MAEFCSKCQTKLSFRNSFVWEGKPVCRDCLNKLEKHNKPEYVTAISKKSSKGVAVPITLGISGFFGIILGLFIFLWARAHSPHMGFGEMLTKFNSYVIKEPQYSFILLFAAGLGIVGIVLLTLGIGFAIKRSSTN